MGLEIKTITSKKQLGLYKKYMDTLSELIKMNPNNEDIKNLYNNILNEITIYESK